MTRHLDLVEWRSKHLSFLAQTISDLDMCRFDGIDALDRRNMAPLSHQLYDHSSCGNAVQHLGGFEGSLVASTRLSTPVADFHIHMIDYSLFCVLECHVNSCWTNPQVWVLLVRVKRFSSAL